MFNKSLNSPSLLYVNEVPEIVNSAVKVFADDTKLYAATTDSAALQEDLDTLTSWAEDWNLTFNVAKCKVIHFGHNNPETPYFMQGRELSKVEEECDLGVIFERDMKFSKHISTKVNKANSILALVKNSFSFMDKHMFMRLYTALVRPHVEFANVVWHTYLKKDIDAIESLQRRATRLVPGIKDLPYSDRLAELKLPSLSYRRLRADALQTYKIIHQFDKCQYEKFFKLSESSTRGHPFKLEKPRCRTTFTLEQFSSRVVNTWNQLPQEVVLAKDVENFKVRFDQHMHNRQYELLH